MLDHNDELFRIRRAYSKYAEDISFAKKWHPENPGNRAIIREREARIHELLLSYHFWPLTPFSILDVGCGTGSMLARFESWGANPKNLTGIDLVPERIAKAKQLYPHIRFICGNAADMEFPPESFDLVVVSTIFSSVLDEELALAIASRIWQVLRFGGAVLWYDFRFNNPRNPNVRGIRLPAIRRLFPDAKIHIESITLLPILARRLGNFTPVLYPVLVRIPILRTHYLGLLLKS